MKTLFIKYHGIKYATVGLLSYAIKYAIKYV